MKRDEVDKLSEEAKSEVYMYMLECRDTTATDDCQSCIHEQKALTLAHDSGLVLPFRKDQIVRTRMR